MSAREIWNVMQMKDILEVLSYVFGIILGVVNFVLFMLSRRRQAKLERKMLGYEKRVSIYKKAIGILRRIYGNAEVGEAENEFFECKRDAEIWFLHDKKIQQLLKEAYYCVGCLVERDSRKEIEGREGENMRKDIRKKLVKIIGDLDSQFMKNL